MHSAVALTIDLIARPSVTPDHAGCHHALREALPTFIHQDLPKSDVANLYSTHGEGSPVIVLAGHCDVVPHGPIEAWQTSPFDPTIKEGVLYGRGAADMKSGLAAMTIALAEFVKENPNHRGTVALLSTSDEEGAGIDGTRHALESLCESNRKPDFALVGEPTSESVFGDMVKVGRRGSITGYLTIKGVQGHVAYPHLADNPIHQLAPFLADLVALKFDDGNDVFPPTSLQVANLNGGTGAVNVIPGQITLDFNIRNSPESPASTIQTTIETLINHHNLDFDLNWIVSAHAFQTDCPILVEALCESIKSHIGIEPKLGTSGGTSDARFFAQFGIPVIEFGPINATIHAANENVVIKDIEHLTNIYKSMLKKLLQ